MKFKFTPRGVAGVFLLKRCPSCTVKDQDELGVIIEDAFKQGIFATLEKTKEVYRGLHSGGCRIMSEGALCDCFLCRIDKLAEEVKNAKY